MFWLVFEEDGDLSVVILAASALVYARLEAHRRDLAAGRFIEAHQLDEKMVRRVPKNMIGRRLTQTEAEKLLSLLA